MKFQLLCALSAVFAATIGLFGQDGQKRPSFAGNWNSGVLERPASYTGNANRPESQLQVGSAFTRLSIRQDTKTIEILEQQGEKGRNTLVYHLDGSPVKNPFRLFLGKTEVNSSGTRVGIEERIPAQYVTTWKGNQLLSAITLDVPGEKELRRYDETISLSADGILSVRIQRVGTGDSRTLNYKKE